jgi:hypothetical protein
MTDQELRLVLQVALLGEVGPALRAVVCQRRYSEVTIRFYIDGEISTSDRESAGFVAAEVNAALPETVRVTEELIRNDAPAKLPHEGLVVFQRREWT